MADVLTGYENYPLNFQLANKRQTKPLMIVVEIDGVDSLYALGPIYQVVRYGDSGIQYGTDDLIYGALRLKGDVKPYISLKGSLQISQKLEPEQGKASIGTFELIMIDKDGDLTKLISPNIVVGEILGGREVKIRLGYGDTAYPEDYLVIFRGSITGTKVQGPTVTLSLSDPASKKKIAVFDATQSSLSSSITSSQSTIPISNTGGFYERILGPDGTYDSLVKTYIMIDDEFMEYTSLTSPTSLAVTRPTTTAPFGFLQSAAVEHDSGADVIPHISLGPINNLTLALKIMLSGHGDNWIDSVPCFALGTDFGMTMQTNIICMNQSVDLKVDYGLTTGDYVTISNSLANNGTYIISSIVADISGQPNKIAYLTTTSGTIPTFSEEINLGATLAFRSKYDTLPLAAGLRMTPQEVDVDMFEYLQQYYFSATTYDLAFGIGEKEANAKDWIDAQLMLPTKCYSLTRFGRVSVGYARPPSTISSKLITINKDNVVDPNNILVTRALNNRRFYNDIVYNYDFQSTGGVYRQIHEEVNAQSLTNTRLKSTLTINSKGARTSYSTSLLAQRVTYALLQRYGNVAFEISLSVNFGTGIMLEAGDIALLQDNGYLKIPNFSTGLRDLGEQLFEVIDRTVNITTGSVKLTLLSGIIDTRKDRYGSISPSSTLIDGSTTTFLQLKDADESAKWSIHIGGELYLHADNFDGYDETCTLVGINAGNASQLIVTGLLAAPPVDTILDIGLYPLSSDKAASATYKAIYAFLSPTLSVVTGISDTSFTVSSLDAAKLFADAVILIHDENWSVKSGEVSVLSVVGTTITTATTLTFTPTVGQLIDFVGFADTNGAYRLS